MCIELGKRCKLYFGSGYGKGIRRAFTFPALSAFVCTGEYTYLPSFYFVCPAFSVQQSSFTHLGVHLQELAEAVLVEMWGYFPIEIEQGEDGEHRSCQIGHLESGNLSNVSAYHDTDADALVEKINAFLAENA
jgi:hypothetical protein